MPYVHTPVVDVLLPNFLDAWKLQKNSNSFDFSASSEDIVENCENDGERAREVGVDDIREATIDNKIN